MPPYADRKIRLAAATPSHSDLVRMTDRKKSVKTSGASAARPATTASAGQLVRPVDAGHAGLPNRPSGRTASTATSRANVTRIE